jgi:hypothetical protein
MHLRVLSPGAGVQSTTLSMMMAAQRSRASVLDLVQGSRRSLHHHSTETAQEKREPVSEALMQYAPVPLSVASFCHPDLPLDVRGQSRDCRSVRSLKIDNSPDWHQRQ